MTGRESPRFYFGDDTMIDVLRVKVTAYSAIEDWIMGDTVVTHTYSTPRCVASLSCGHLLPTAIADPPRARHGSPQPSLHRALDSRR